jgi:hypothetical protein
LVLCRVEKVDKSSAWLERRLSCTSPGEARKGPTGKLIELAMSVCEMIYDGKRWGIASAAWDDIGRRPWPADLDSERQK